jgi:hypothetical protein
MPRVPLDGKGPISGWLARVPLGWVAGVLQREAVETPDMPAKDPIHFELPYAGPGFVSLPNAEPCRRVHEMHRFALHEAQHRTNPKGSHPFQTQNSKPIELNRVLLLSQPSLGRRSLT